MQYHKIGNEWVKYQHNPYMDTVERCIKSQPDLVCTEVKKTGSGWWSIGWPNKISIWKFKNEYTIYWSRHLRHLHFEGDSISEDGKKFWSLAHTNNQFITMKVETKFSKALQESLNIYYWLKNDLGIFDETFYCLDEKSWCKEISPNSISINDIDISLHKVNFKNGLQEILVA